MIDRDLNDIAVFVCVVEARSFTGAGTQLGVPRSTVSRRVAQLEKRMYEHARNLEFEQAAKLRDEISDLKEQSVGLPPRAVEAG